MYRRIANAIISASRVFIILLAVLTLSSMAVIAGFEKGNSGDPIWIYDSDLEVRHIATGNLDDDGIPDVIAAEYSNNYYDLPSRVYGIAGATGDTLWTYLCQDGIRSMATDDINGDGTMDVVVGASSGTTTPDGSVHAIDGKDGTAMWVYPVGSTNQTVAIGDLDGTGFLDVAVGSFDDYIYAISGSTGGLLWSREIGSLWINKISLADADGDGLDDVAYAHEYLAGWDNYLGILKGTSGNVIWADTVDWIAADVLMTDIDDDGDNEAIFVALFSDDHGELLVRDGATGALEWSFDLGPINHTNGIVGLWAYDYDADTDLELFVGHSGGYMRVFEGDVATPLWTNDSLPGAPDDVAFGDVTGNGELNVIIATGDRVLVLSAEDGIPDYYYAVAGSINSVDVGDFDNDGILDIAAGGGAEYVGTPPNPGKGVWTIKTVSSPLLWEYNFGEYGNSVATGDLNGDGYDDAVAVASLEDAAFAVDGVTGQLLWTWAGTENLYAATSGDFNNDGLMDVAVAGNDDMVTALNGPDGAVLWQFTAMTDQIYRSCLKSTDLNADGAADVIAGSDNSIVYAIDGDKGDEIWSTDVGTKVGDVVLAQMNGTGPLDVVVGVESGTGGERVVVLDGINGAILWEYLAPDQVQHVGVLDANNDGIPDIVAAITPWAQQVIMIDGATQTTLWTVPVVTASNVQSLVVGDLNGDGNEDVVVPTSTGAHALSGIDGSTLWIAPTGGEVNCLLAFDVENDGVLDIVAGADDQIVYFFDGPTGATKFSFSTADDVMDVDIAEFEGAGKPGVVAVTFGSDGVMYAFESLWEGEPSCCVGMTGDIDNLGDVNVADLTYLVDYLFAGGAAPVCLEEADVNLSGSIDVADLTYVVDYLFAGGPAPMDCL